MHRSQRKFDSDRRDAWQVVRAGGYDEKGSVSVGIWKSWAYCQDNPSRKGTHHENYGGKKEVLFHFKENSWRGG